MGEKFSISYEEFTSILEMIKTFGEMKVPDGTFSDNACCLWSDILSVVRARNGNMTDKIRWMP